MSRLLTNLVVRLGSGLVGAVALTAAHEALRTKAPRGLRPRMDAFGIRALKKMGSAVGLSAGHGTSLRRRALIGDVIANTAFFTMVGGRRPLTRGLVLGLLAGLGAVLLPPRLGLGRAPGGAVCAGTIGLYLLGGLAAASAAWLARTPRGAHALDDEARARADLARDSVINMRDSGMIH